MLTDFSVFTRFVVAVPLFFVAELMLHVRCTRTIERFVNCDFSGDDGFGAIEHSLRRAARLRDLPAVELGIAALAVLGGQLSLWDVFGDAGWAHGAVDTDRLSLPHVWYSVVALPLFQFLLFRWLWRWAIWSRVLYDLSRLRLRLVPLHPDRAGGILLLADPTYAFAFFAAGASSVFAGAWATKLAFRGALVQDFALHATLLAAIASILAFGPLTLFFPTMVRERFEGVRSQARLAVVYANLFSRRWLEGPIDDSVLGSSDIQSLADLQNSYQGLSQMRLVPFGPRQMLTVVVCVIAPLVPLVAFQVPFNELLVKIGRTLFLGLPQ